MQDTGNDTIEVVVEIPRGSRNKHEYDHRRGVFVLNRLEDKRTDVVGWQDVAAARRVVAAARAAASDGTV